ncbi:hypothetical protein HELRODRAFT_165230 [Helobdella robusta]|uniref:PLAT domain-containing protein n=1 Tax=Helobdella robusta TaxID=6412 RepID=T1EWG9_HELRO|nr:hypothetical protein HELRODRAFT_165230 [Helobdella robusta]ESN93071.1 hypothetical protein HELRODRAFT_165230 [Helobdella robusta]
MCGSETGIFLTIYGKSRKSGRLFLEKSNNEVMFGENQSDVFRVNTQSVGPVTKIRLEREQLGTLCYKWYLRRVVLTDLNNTSWMFFFHCDRWLEDKYGDGLISVILPTSTNPVDIKTLVTYNVTIFTGNKQYSGTSANIFITLMGTLGTSGERKISNGPLNKESETQSKVESLYLGSLTKIQIRHDNTGKSPDWFLEKVVVDDNKSERTYTFHCRQWLATNRADGKLSRILHLGNKIIPDFSDDDEDDGSRKKKKERQDDDEDCEFEVVIQTGDKMNAGTSASVYAIFYARSINSNQNNNNKTNKSNNKYNNYSNNNMNNDGKHNLHQSKNKILEMPPYKIEFKGGKFSRGHLDVFNIRMRRRMFPLDRIVIGHDGSGVGSGWFLQNVKVRSLSHNKSQIFNCNKWLAKDEDDGLIERTLYSEDAKKSSGNPSNYKVVIRTSDVLNAGTDANVFIQLCGSKRETASLELKKSTKNLNKFERGSVDEFELQADRVGSIKKLKIWHDGSGVGSDWNVQDVQIIAVDDDEEEEDDEDDDDNYHNQNAKRHHSKSPKRKNVYNFQLNRWIKKSDGVVEIKEGSKKNEQPKARYRVQVRTSDVSNAGTDANVFVQLCGSQKQTEKLELKKSAKSMNKFERGCTDEFDLQADHVGPAKYRVQVRTSDVSNAGTDANVFVQLCGSQKQTEKLELKKSAKNMNKFERGCVDEFELHTDHVGPIKRLKVWHDGSGVGSDWHVQDVQIVVDENDDDDDNYYDRRKQKNSKHHKKLYKFVLDRWIKKSDGVVEVNEGASQNDKNNKNGKNDIPKARYRVQVRTSDVSNAGTDANVFIQLCGPQKMSESLELKKSAKNINKFERGSVDEFELQADPVGPIKRLKIWHDGSGVGSDWHVQDVQILAGEDEEEQDEDDDDYYDRRVRNHLNNPKKKLYKFLLDRWIKKSDGVVEVSEGTSQTDNNSKNNAKNSKKKKIQTKYRIQVKTSDVSNAGTDANVFVQLCGPQKQTDSLELNKSTKNVNKFERGNVDEFKLEAEYVGPIEKLKIWQDGKGFGSDWSVDYIKVFMLLDNHDDDDDDDDDSDDDDDYQRQKGKKRNGNKNNGQNVEEEFTFKINRWINENDGVVVVASEESMKKKSVKSNNRTNNYKQYADDDDDDDYYGSYRRYK